MRKHILAHTNSTTPLPFDLCKLMNRSENADLFLQSGADLVLILDKNEHILFMNNRGYDLLEYEYGSLQNKNWIEHCVPVTRASDLRAYLGKLFNPLPATDIAPNTLNHPLAMHAYENQVITQSGYKLLFNFRNFALINDQDQVEALLCLGSNVTGYRKTERELSYSLSKYKTLFDHFPLGITLADENGKIIETNPMSAKILELDPDEHCTRTLGGNTWRIVNRNLDPMNDSEFASVRALKEKCSIFNQEMGFVKADDTITWLSVNASPIDHPDASVLVTYSDITDKIQIENLLLAREKIRLFAANPEHTLHDLLQKLLDEAELLTNSHIGFAHFLEADQETLILQTWSTNTLKHMCKINNSGQHYAVKEAGVWVECIHTKAPVIHNDYANMANKKGLPHGHAPVDREMVVPIIRFDKIVAIIGLGNKPSNYTDHDLNAVMQLSDLVWDIIWQKRSDQALEALTLELQNTLAREKHAANTDFLTGIFNRRSLLDSLAQQIKLSNRYKEPMSILLFDLDHFKHINDTFGHLVGDQILIHVTQTVQGTLRESDILGRYGGEEFVVILPKTHIDEALVLAERIRHHVHLNPYTDASQGFVTSSTNTSTTINATATASATISIGVATYLEDETVEQLINKADDAMYRAKTKGRNCIST